MPHAIRCPVLECIVIHLFNSIIRSTSYFVEQEAYHDGLIEGLPVENRIFTRNNEQLSVSTSPGYTLKAEGSQRNFEQF
jgi:hypothetical protein